MRFLTLALILMLGLIVPSILLGMIKVLIFGKAYSGLSAILGFCWGLTYAMFMIDPLIRRFNKAWPSS